MDIGVTLSIVSAAAGWTIAIITFRSWRKLRPGAQLKRDRQAHLRLLAVYLCELLNVHELPPHRLTRQQFIEGRWSLAGREVAQQLSRLLDEAGRLGLILANERRGGWHKWGQFRHFVEQVAKNDPSWGKPPPAVVEGFLVGTMHLVGECRGQLEGEGNGELLKQLDVLWDTMAGDYWA